MACILLCVDQTRATQCQSLEIRMNSLTVEKKSNPDSQILHTGRVVTTSDSVSNHDNHAVPCKENAAGATLRVAGAHSNIVRLPLVPNNDSHLGWTKDSVFRRTRRGGDEIVFGRRELSPELWDLLLHIDGKRDVSVLKNLSKSFRVSPALLIYLVDGGFVDQSRKAEPTSLVHSTEYSVDTGQRTATAPGANLGPDQADRQQMGMDGQRGLHEARDEGVLRFKEKLSVRVNQLMGEYAAPIIESIAEVSDEASALSLLAGVAALLEEHFGAREAQSLLGQFEHWFNPA
jgi:hypothetical protein